MTRTMISNPMGQPLVTARADELTVGARWVHFAQERKRLVRSHWVRSLLEPWRLAHLP